MLSVIQEGDVVARNSYNRDVYFKVCRLYTGEDGIVYASLKGLDLRLEANAPLDDLVRIDPAEISMYCEERQAECMEKIKYIVISRDESRRRRFRLAINSPS